LLKNGEITIDDNQVLPEENSAYYFGDEVSFSINGLTYLWSRDDIIYRTIEDKRIELITDASKTYRDQPSELKEQLIKLSVDA